MRVFMYITAFLVLAIGITASVFEMKGTMPIPEGYLPLAKGIAASLLLAFVFIGLAGLYGAVGKQGTDGSRDSRSRDSRHRARSGSSRSAELAASHPTTRLGNAKLDEPADDDLFVVTPLDAPEEPE